MSKNQNVQDISKLIYEPLLKITEDFKLEPTLATEWSKADNTSYLIKLRGNVKWHNGADFNADDVKFTIDTIKSLGDGYIYYSNVQNIDYVEIISSDLLKIHLFQEEALFEYNLTFPIICSTFYDEDDILISSKNNIPMGTGIYKINSVDINTQMQLKINTNWWNLSNISPKAEELNVKIFSSVAEMYNAYKLGSLDILTTMQSSNIEQNIGTIGYNKKDICGRQFDYLALNCKENVLSNKEVRQAISYAINKEEINNVAYGGKYIIKDFPLSYGSYLYNEKTQEYNQDKAKEILQSNGWEYKNNYWQKKVNRNNIKVKIDLVVNSSNQGRVKAANVIKENLEKIGIPVKIISVKDTTYQNYITNKNYDILITGVTVGTKPDLSRYFGENNLANYENTDASSILNELYSISDENTLKEKYKTLQTIYEDDRAYIGLYFDTISLITTKSFAGTINPTWYNLFYNIQACYRKN